MKIGLLYQKNNFVGREYFHALHRAGIRITLLGSVGSCSEKTIEFERLRCGGIWNPPQIPQDRVDAEYSNLNDTRLWSDIHSKNLDIVIQGGIGILKSDYLSIPNIGFLNVHPGKLPKYRGCSCPEWAIYNGDEVILTAHLLDSGIDTGPILMEEKYQFTFENSYARFRAGIYPLAGILLTRAIKLLFETNSTENARKLFRKQSSIGSNYWKTIPEDKHQKIRSLFGENDALL